MKVHAPEDMHSAFAEAYNAGSIQNLLDLYEPEAVLIPRPGQRAAGLAAIRDSLQEFVNLRGRMTIQTLVCLHSGDLALLQGVWQLSATGTDGQTIELGARTAEVVRKQPDGSWLYVLDNAFADQVPGVET